MIFPMVSGPYRELTEQALTRLSWGQRFRPENKFSPQLGNKPFQRPDFPDIPCT